MKSTLTFPTNINHSVSPPPGTAKIPSAMWLQHCMTQNKPPRCSSAHKVVSVRQCKLQTLRAFTHLLAMGLISEAKWEWTCPNGTSPGRMCPSMGFKLTNQARADCSWWSYSNPPLDLSPSELVYIPTSGSFWRALCWNSRGGVNKSFSERKRRFKISCTVTHCEDLKTMKSGVVWSNISF